MTDVSIQRSPTKAPLLIRASGPIVGSLLRWGLRMGPNGLLTVRGRRSGKLRRQPLAIVEIDGRRFVVGTFGDVNWCRNLRVSPEAELMLRGRSERVLAQELDREHAVHFFREVIPDVLDRMPRPWSLLTRILVGAAAPDVLGDPALAATRRPVFELVAANRSTAASGDYCQVT